MQNNSSRPTIIGYIQPPRAGPSQLPIHGPNTAPRRPYTVIYDKYPFFEVIR